MHLDQALAPDAHLIVERRLATMGLVRLVTRRPSGHVARRPSDVVDERPAVSPASRFARSRGGRMSTGAWS